MSSSMVFRRAIVAHDGILALRDEEPSETNRHNLAALSTMITSREIRLKFRPVGMLGADNFELATLSVPPQAFLGVAGMSGLTAWVGLLKIAMLKPGVVFV